MNITDNITTFLFQLIGKIASKKTIENRTKFGRRIGNLIRLIGYSRYKIAIENVEQSFPDFSKSKCKKTAKCAFYNLGITMVEWACFPYISNEELEEYVTFENVDLLKKLISKGKSIIFLSGHFGNWELMVYSFSKLQGIPVNIIVKKQSNKKADDLMNSYRELGGNKTIPMKEVGRSLIKAIRSNEHIAMLVDQAAAGNNKPLYPIFFDRPASTYQTPAYLSLKFDLPLVTGYMQRKDDGRYLVKLHEIPHEDLPCNDEGVAVLTQRHVSQLEKVIRAYPNHWSWMHNRWKRVPKEILEQNKK